jgi:hypothetical protein
MQRDDGHAFGRPHRADERGIKLDGSINLLESLVL